MVIDVKDGVEVVINVSKYSERVTCCDCGLTHDIVYRIVDKNNMGITVWRNNRATGQHRRSIPER